MYTLGYAFKPWTEAKAIADGPSILKYVRETATGERHRPQGHPLRPHGSGGPTWSTDRRRSGLSRPRYRARSSPIHLQFPVPVRRLLFLRRRLYAGLSRASRTSRGRMVHPQQWPADLDYAGKSVVVIGSGATAVTLVPEMARTAAHVTMLQRSPTYVVSASRPRTRWPITLRKWLPGMLAYNLDPVARNVLGGMYFFNLARKKTGTAVKAGIIKMVQRRTGPGLRCREALFTPTYNPWDQRLCLVPDADMFQGDQGRPRIRRNRPYRNLHKAHRHPAEIRARNSRPTSSSRRRGWCWKSGTASRVVCRRRVTSMPPRRSQLQGHDV